MEEKKIKKKKLTLTVSSNKPYNIPHYRSSKQKTSVVIEKKISRKKNERRFHDQDKSVSKSAPGFINKTKSKIADNFPSKSTAINKNFEIRKKAEERATKRFKSSKENNLVPKKGNLGKNKSPVTKREYKLTLSKALTDGVMDMRERSLASVRRARIKEKKNQDSNNKKIETKQSQRIIAFQEIL